ncbi:MAG TPA: DMT family transporter [Candidatus Saccharimonadales bacterium]|nr:DMT family transporter [Candidatus Saccharimonadales bacterium]
MKAQKTSRAPIGASLIVLSSVFYATYGVWTKLMGDFFGSFTASALRCALVFGGLIVLAMARRELQKINWRRDRKWLVAMVISSIFVSAPLYYAVLHAGVGISLAIAYIGIVIGMFMFGWLFENERFTKEKLIATALGILGIVLVFSPSIKLGGWLALAGALAAGLATAANMATTKKVPYNGSQSAILVWGSGVVANVPLVFLFGEPLPSVGWHAQWGYLALFAAASLVASWTFIKGLKLVEAGAAGILGLLEVVFGVFFGALFFRERPSLLVLIGITSIIAAAAIPYLQHYNARKGTLD